MTAFLERVVEKLRSSPLGPVVRLVEAHPRLSAWAVLSAGMIILLVIEARDVGLLAGQWVALIVASILVAGACIWIISWENGAEGEPEQPATSDEQAGKGS
jgi:hypothetical protein